jgi:hypothetical protein
VFCACYDVNVDGRAAQLHCASAGGRGMVADRLFRKGNGRKEIKKIIRSSLTILEKGGKKERKTRGLP